MLTSVTIRGLSLAQSRTLTFPFRDAGVGNSPYFVKKASGLDPVNADVNMSSYPEMDEDVLDSTRVGGRNPQFLIGLRPRRSAGETVESLRQGLYRVLSPKTPVRITLNFDTLPQMYVDGIVEIMGPSVFDKNTDMTISIKSTAAYLTSTTVVKNQGFQTNTVNNLMYEGTAPSPIEFSQTMVRACTSVSVKLNGSTLLTVTYPFATDDVLTFSTVPRAKFIQRTRGGVVLSLLDQITTGSLDMFIDAATESFAVTNNFGNALAAEKFLLSYTAKYVGV